MAASVPVVSAGSIDQRFAQLIQQFGLTKNSFAISLGKTASVVQHLIDGRNKPGFDLMCKVFEVYPNVSRDWLLLGRGPMLIGSSGLSGPALAAAQPAAPEPDFEPIDLADVAPRAARRPSALRLHPDEIAATLAIASSVADGLPAVASAPAPTSPVAAGPYVPEAQASIPAPQPAPFVRAAPVVPNPAAAAAAAVDARRPMRPFRAAPAPHAAPAPATTSEIAAPPISQAEAEAPVPAPAAAPVSPMSAALPATSQPLAVAPTANPEAYVAAAIHAQHLQHQLALAELRNQHLFEQQQMLREMLAMARQSMV
jgi:hypothetical protein